MKPFNLRMPEGIDADESLRALDWSALLARLGAERDLRREFAANNMSGGAADFVNGAARIAGDSSHGAQSVNPETLADRKPAEDITAAAREKTRAARKMSVRGKQ